MDESALAEQVEALIDATAVVSKFEPDEQTAQALMIDLSRQIHKNDTIAERYGLSMRQLYEFVQVPAVRKRIKELRAVWFSDANTTERNRALYGVLALDISAPLNRMIFNPQTPPSVKLDAAKIIGRFAGLDAPVKASVGDVQGAGPGAQFSVTINFAGGQQMKVFAPVTPPDIESEAA